jgi:hypothetical protein
MSVTHIEDIYAGFFSEKQNKMRERKKSAILYISQSVLVSEGIKRV